MLATLLLATLLGAGAPSTVVLDGSSNLADWQCRGSSMDARMTVATTPAHLNAVIDRIEDGNIAVWMASPQSGRFPTPEFTLRIPVAAFRCGNRVMESDLRRALNAESHPSIDFAFRELRGGIQHDIDEGTYGARIAGDLSLAGVTRRLEIDVDAERISPTRFRLRATLPLRMTEFGVKPPTALFGAVRARDELTVRFDLTLEIRP
jgi:YceI-like domain